MNSSSAPAAVGEQDIYVLKDIKPTPDPYFSYDIPCHIPLIIDNGSYQCRVGWATDTAPRMIFRNCYAKHRKDRGRKGVAETEILIANDISNIEAVRFNLKSPFDENVVTHFETQEVMFDYTFNHLGINTTGVNHPIIITEPFCNPNYSRQLMSELLFECYEVPSVSYCIDCLLSFYYNKSETADGMVVSAGNCTTHIVPILHGMVDIQGIRRIRMGGSQLTKFLWRWLQLRYPQHLNALTISRAEELLHSRLFIADNYMNEISKWCDPNYYERHVKKIQLPFIAQIPTPTLSAEQQRERKREAAKRLLEINAKKREDKLQEDEQELLQLQEAEQILEEFSPGDPEYHHTLEVNNATSLEELQKRIALLEQRIEKTKLRILQSSNVASTVEEMESNEKRNKKEDTEEFLKKLEDIRQQWFEIHSRRNARRQKRQEMAKRRTAASQERMRIISQLAKREKKDDTFGMRDEDWDVYKAINKDGGGSDSEAEDEKLQGLESILRQHDPEFFGDSASHRPLTVAEKYQFHLSTEQIRIGELLFQPSMNGVEQGGISDTIDYVLKLYDANTQARLANNIFVTSGCGLISGILPRLNKDLLSLRPFKSEFYVSLAQNPLLDAWFGAKQMSDQLLKIALTREEYNEYGGDRIKEHKASNKFWSPLPFIESEDSVLQTSS